MFSLKRSVAAAILATALGAPGIALAHDAGAAAAPGWTFTPWLVGLLLVSLGLEGVGLARLMRRVRRGRTGLVRAGLLFLAGWIALGVAAVSPLHAAGERSFTLHMIEHEVLMLVAAPLLVLSRPLRTMIWAFPGPARLGLARAGRPRLVRSLWRGLTSCTPATLLQAGCLWLWHMPALFDLALSSASWHIAQHLSFLVPALFFWQATLVRDARRPLLPVLCLFATSVVAGALGALMALSQSPWYDRYATLGLAPFGLSPVEDQQLAGLLMWIPGGLLHAGAALVLIARFLRRPTAPLPTFPTHPAEPGTATRTTAARL
jgi:putative membrane protein